jgi:hypothetical protein
VLRAPASLSNLKVGVHRVPVCRVLPHSAVNHAQEDALSPRTAACGPQLWTVPKAPRFNRGVATLPESLAAGAVLALPAACTKTSRLPMAPMTSETGGHEPAGRWCPV